MALTPSQLSSKTTFFDIQLTYSMGSNGKDRDIRSKDVYSLYTGGKDAPSKSAIALNSFNELFKSRAAKREAGVELIKQAIDGEYGKGTADRVLSDIRKSTGRDLSTGIRRSDLGLIGGTVDRLEQVGLMKDAIDEEYGKGMADRVLSDIRKTTGVDLTTGTMGSDLSLMRKTADRLVRADKDPLGKFDKARNDPNIANLGSSGPLPYGKLRSFLSDNYDVVRSQNFWATPQARSNVESIGSALAMNVLDRIAVNGKIEQQDLDDLSAAMMPYELDPSTDGERKYAAAPPLGGHLIGSADEPRMQELTQVVYDRFIDPEAEMAVNSGTEHTMVTPLFTQPHTSRERIQGMNAILESIAGGSGASGKVGIEKPAMDAILKSLR